MAERGKRSCRTRCNFNCRIRSSEKKVLALSLLIKRKIFISWKSHYCNTFLFLLCFRTNIIFFPLVCVMSHS